jgi:hypothetical protein
MVLVESAWRGRGIGTALVRHALDWLKQVGIHRVRLDATSFGQRLYERQGFVPDYAVLRFTGRLPAADQLGESVSPLPVQAARREDYDGVYELDAAVVGGDRQRWLARLFHERPADVRVVTDSGRISGYATVRAGSLALQIGPCVADRAAGAVLIQDACRRYAGRQVILDVPSVHNVAVHLAGSLGLHVERSFVRMSRGAVSCDDLARLWASSGPEVG